MRHRITSLKSVQALSFLINQLDVYSSAAFFPSVVFSSYPVQAEGRRKEKGIFVFHIYFYLYVNLLDLFGMLKRWAALHCQLCDVNSRYFVTFSYLPRLLKSWTKRTRHMWRDFLLSKQPTAAAVLFNLCFVFVVSLHVRWPFASNFNILSLTDIHRHKYNVELIYSCPFTHQHTRICNTVTLAR